MKALEQIQIHNFLQWRLLILVVNSVSHLANWCKHKSRPHRILYYLEIFFCHNYEVSFWKKNFNYYVICDEPRVKLYKRYIALLNQFSIVKSTYLSSISQVEVLLRLFLLQCVLFWASFKAHFYPEYTLIINKILCPKNNLTVDIILI